MKLRDLEKLLKKRCDQLCKRKARRSLSKGASFMQATVSPTSIDKDTVTGKGAMGVNTHAERTFKIFSENNNQDEENGKESKDSSVKSQNMSYFDCKSEENLPMDFFKHTSLHGLKYIGERKQHLIERIFWIISFMIGLIVAYYMISVVWSKYKNNSVIITFAPYETKIEEIPFPAITICNMNKVLKSKATQFMKEAKGPSRHEATKAARENLYYLNHVCSSSKSFTRAFNYSAQRGKIDSMSLNAANKNEDNYDGGKEDLWQFFLEASPLCRDMILKCVWQEEIKNCSEFFIPIETDYGKCCTFNMIPPSILHRINMTGIRDDSSNNDDDVPWAWDGDSLFRKDSDTTEKVYPEFPRRQKIAGKSFGLSVLLNPDLDEYFCTTSDSMGFRIVSHLPIDVPHISDLGSAIKPDSEVFINIRPEVTIADKENIGHFSLQQRQCYFNEEHNLGYYNYYSSSNCMDECIANLTYQECNCRRHYQPGDDSKPLCGPKQFQCASNIKKKFVGNYKVHCKMCIPTCTEITYHTETTYTSLQAPDILWTDSRGKLASWSKTNVSIVHIYFGEGSTNAKLRKKLYEYGTVDLIANFGGLMGLCLGFSGLSLVEVIYFLTLRAWCRSKRNHNGLCRTGLENNKNIKKNNGMKRTETTTELIGNEVACTTPVNRSTGVAESFEMANNARNAEVLRSLQGKGNTASSINHILYTVALAHDTSNLNSQNNGGLCIEKAAGTHM